MPKSNNSTIWIKKSSPEHINLFLKGTLCEHLEMTITQVEDDRLVATMPVDHRTVQPMGFLHGGATAALAESLGSVASYLCLEEGNVVGVELNISHLGSTTKGLVTGICRNVKLGRRSHVWQIDIHREDNKPISSARLTTFVL